MRCSSVICTDYITFAITIIYIKSVSLSAGGGAAVGIAIIFILIIVVVAVIIYRKRKGLSNDPREWFSVFKSGGGAPSYSVDRSPYATSGTVMSHSIIEMRPTGAVGHISVTLH